jgi:hypothetical protein
MKYEPQLTGALGALRDQLIIVLAKRLAKDGVLRIPVKEIDDTGQDMMTFEVDQKTNEFVFRLRKKS